MTDRYVGPGGSDGSNGLSWANRKLTLTGVEDTPVVAGDTVYVGPGTYRETLTLDVSGSSGNPITYIADVTGENTDGVGGAVRITASDDDLVSQSRVGITALSRDYRTFRGFHFDFYPNTMFQATTCENLVVEDCVFNFPTSSSNKSLDISVDATGHAATIRRCLFFSHAPAIEISGNFSTNIRIENCIFVKPYPASTQYAIDISNTYGVYIVNCTFLCYVRGGGGSGSEGRFLYNQTSGVNYLYNCIISGEQSDVGAGDLTSDYNVWGRLYETRDADISVGANAHQYPVLFNPPLFIDGMIFPWMIGELAPHSPAIGLACNSDAPSDDFFGIPRPTSDAKKTRGAIQNSLVEKSTTQIEGTWPYSIKLPDAMAKQFVVPITGNQMTIAAEVYREADYAGTLPQLIIRQPGQSARTNTDVGAASQWNSLSDTFTPASSPPYIIVEIRSDNTATSGSYGTYFSSLVAD
jgi:hypothetical protein